MGDILLKLNPLTDPQLAIKQAKGRFKIILAGRRFGKSVLCSDLAINEMLNYRRCAYITPQYSLAKVFYTAILQVLPDEIIAEKNKSDLFIKLITGGTLKFFTGERLDAIRGQSFHLVIIDEAAYIPDLKEQWDRAIRPTLTDTLGGAVMVSTPRGKEFFNSLYHKGINKEDGYVSFRYTTYDNKYIKKAEIEEARASLPEAVFNQEYLAIPAENANNPFGTNHIQKNIIKVLSKEPTVTYGIDVAKYNDWTVITGLDNKGYATYFDRFRQPWEVTKNKIRRLPSNIMKVMDSTGVGDVIFEELQLDVPNLQGFKFTTQSKPKLIYELIKDVEKGNVKYNQITADEMSVFEYKYSPSGHIKFEAAAGYHDDCIASLALANKYRKEFKQVNNWKLGLA